MPEAKSSSRRVTMVPAKDTASTSNSVFNDIELLKARDLNVREVGRPRTFIGGSEDRRKSDSACCIRVVAWMKQCAGRKALVYDADVSQKTLYA